MHRTGPGECCAERVPFGIAPPQRPIGALLSQRGQNRTQQNTSLHLCLGRHVLHMSLTTGAFPQNAEAKDVFRGGPQQTLPAPSQPSAAPGTALKPNGGRLFPEAPPASGKSNSPTRMSLAILGVAGSGGRPS